VASPPPSYAQANEGARPAQKSAPASNAKAPEAETQNIAQGQLEPQAQTEAGTTTGLAANSETKEPLEQQLYRQARQQASSGRCTDALTLSRKIAKVNPDFYKKRVAGDPTLTRCTASPAKAKTAAPVQQERARDASEDQKADKAAK
jgi:hypothetical protein